jgi:DNA-binding NtrC family response regulator
MTHSLQAIKQRFGIIGMSPMLNSALETAMRVAATDLSVLIQGESGTGKEAFSKIIHALSTRKHNQFIAVNCGAIPNGTINSELFGHEKGSFTGSVGDRKGYFETVNGGTIFLDEIGEMPHDTQAYLLRVLENGEFLRVGSSKVEKTDVRIIAATNVKLEEAVRKGKFREDLYYRLNTVPIKVPSLKERPDDINLLFQKFSMDFAEKYRVQPVSLDEKGQMLLENYPFPGNIRELRNMAEQLSILSEKRELTATELMELMPQLMRRNLPSVVNNAKEEMNMNERDILYKIMFDLRASVDEMKKLLFELIKSNNLQVPSQLLLEMASGGNYDYKNAPPPVSNGGNSFFEDKNESPRVIFNPPNLETMTDETAHEIETEHEEVEEARSMAEVEKRQILKILKKNNFKRKETATQLGISERTLYRKLKEYHIDM